MEKLVQIGASSALAYSASYIAALVLVLVVLAIRVVQVRRAKLIGLGDGGDKELLRRIRAHGNCAENTPMLIGLLVALPLVGAGAWIVHLVGLTGLVGRILHGFGISQSAGSSLGRIGGMALTFASLISGALALLVLAWR